MKFLYIDTIQSGISGDIFLAALLDLIDNPKIILNELKELRNELSGISVLDIDLIKVSRSGVQVNQVKINIKESKSSRTAAKLKSALNSYLTKRSFSDLAKTYANNVLESLIQAEAEVHGKLNEKIHLHELSSVDTLIDIIGVSKILDILGVFKDDFKVLCSKLPLGGGEIESAHGKLPIPAPATVKILEKSKIITFNGPIESELTTPTGAALLVNLKPELLTFSIGLDKVAYSTGQKEFKDFLNICRIFYGESEIMNDLDENNPLSKYIEQISVIETDIDDMTGEVLGNFINIMEKEEVLDIQVIPSITKKNRPAHIIKILCKPNKTFEIIEKILEKVGTLGVRYNIINRVCVDREIEKHVIEIKDKRFEVNYKISFIKTEKGKKIVNIKPEYEDLKSISKSSGLSIKEILFYANHPIKEIFERTSTS